MKNEPQDLYLETECRVREHGWAGGKGELRDEQREQQTSRWHEPPVRVCMWASSQFHWVTEFTQRRVAEEQKAVIVRAKQPELEGISGLAGLTCCSQKQKPRPRQGGSSTNQQVPCDKPPISKDLAHSSPNTRVSFPVENLPENL